MGGTIWRGWIEPRPKPPLLMSSVSLWRRSLELMPKNTGKERGIRLSAVLVNSFTLSIYSN